MADKQESPKSRTIQVYGRGRFLVLDVPKKFDDTPGQKARWESTLMIDPSSKQGAACIKELLDEAAALSKEHYGKVPLALKKLKVKFVPGTPALDLNDPKNEPDGIRLFCMADGDAEKYKNYAGYQGMFILAASNNKLKPDVANRKGVKVLPGEPQYPYDGSHIRMSVSFWLLMGAKAQSTGRLLGCNLRGVQFYADGDAFTQDTIENEFQPMAEDDQPEGAKPAAASTDDWD